ncbi:MAG: alpha/beta fold hydrolase [Burkholderiaceae bacterium]
MKTELADGSIAYSYTGNQALDPNKPAVVFIHGAQNDHSVWALQSRYLAHHGYQVLAIDLPGHGASNGAPLPSIPALADWINTLLDTLGIARAVLVGHSMGSLIALACSHRHPGRVSGLALIGSAFPMKVSEQLLTAAANDEAQAIDMICNWSHSGLTFWPGNPGFSVFMLSKRLMQRQKPGVLAVDFNACNEWEDGMEAAQACTCPTLLISGANDMMTPARAIKQIHLALTDTATSSGQPSPKHLILPNCGHSIMAERPSEVLNALKPFLEACNATTPRKAVSSS